MSQQKTTLKLTVRVLILFSNRKTDNPSGKCPINPYGADNLTSSRANTKSNSGNIITPMPQTSPCNPHINGFGKVAKAKMNFL